MGKPVAEPRRGALSREDAAAYLSVSITVLDRLRADGKIGFVKLGEDGARRVRVLFAVKELDAFLERECQTIDSSKSATRPAGISSGKRAAGHVALQRMQKTVRRQRSA